MVEQAAVIPTGRDGGSEKRDVYYVYVLRSESLDRFYVGMSADPKKRLVYHNAGETGGKSAFTKRASDWELVWTEAFDSREAALARERKIKKAKSRKYIEELVNSKNIPG